jgi:hypothetical protein
MDSMPMTRFWERFQEIAGDETRTVRVSGIEGLPDGEYGFCEFYCNEPGCDCRRVVIVVLRPETGWKKIWGSINYGWESAAFYEKWVGGPVNPAETQGPMIDPLNDQSDCAPMLLEIFRGLIQSPDYVARLKRHYRMFRAAIDQERGAGLIEKRPRLSDIRGSVGRRKRSR